MAVRKERKSIMPCYTGPSEFSEYIHFFIFYGRVVLLCASFLRVRTAFFIFLPILPYHEVDRVGVQWLDAEEVNLPLEVLLSSLPLRYKVLLLKATTNVNNSTKVDF